MTTKRLDVSGPGFSDDDSPPASNLSSMQRAIVTIQKMRTKLEALERARTEPIAIVGMACRIPGGANTPEAFYKLLEDGIDTVREIPADRWPVENENPNSDGDTRALRWGSFLANVDRFDASFFGISPREAESLDPQHRLLLEVTWEALERAGQLPERLMGTKTGVFVGIWAPDYQLRVLARDPAELDAYGFTGTVLSTAAGRLSYTLGVQGPCMVVDTACSSSLTAIHLACQSLRSGESTMAIAGGVNLMLAPSTSKLLSKTQALSPDGRCKTFDARANGYVRGEGCGILVLKRLSDAERDGDSIVALIRGSAVNQDGRSTGLTAPNVLSQQTLLRQALENARLSAQDITYLETHGTGTPLGDPIEVEAIKAVLGAPRERGATCVLGALKSNIGHLEAAAGVAGVIKAVLAIQNDKIPNNLHFRSLNPRIDLTGTSLEIAQSAKPWTPGVRPRYAGVSSFGISGTNAHVIIEEPPRNLEEALIDESNSTLLLPLSAKTPEALRALAVAFQDMLRSESCPRLLDVVYTASARRSHYVHRLSVVGRTKEEMAERLGSYLQTQDAVGISEGKSTPARAKIVFVFSGQGSQWLGMGRQLYASDASFRSVIDNCDNLMTSRLGWSILDELDAPETMSRIHETQVAQPLLFAVQVALVEMLRSWGISPDAMIGHSVGEIAAAHIAGILSLDEAIRLVSIRGRIMQKATGMGKMVSVSMTPDQAHAILVGYEDRVSIAAINDPSSVVLSGVSSIIDDIVVRCEKQGFETRPLRVDYAFHSPQMEPLQQELVERLVRVDTRRATLAMYSTVLADCVDGKELDVKYWGRNIRETVDFAGAIFAAIRDGYQLFLEVGPHPVLVNNVQHCLVAKGVDGAANYAMRRNQDQRRILLEAIGTLYTRGCSPEWSRVVPQGGKSVPLPTYPWQRERYWIDFTPATTPMVTLDARSGKDHDALQDVFLTLDWRKAEKGALPVNGVSHDAAHSWLVLADRSDVADVLIHELESKGESCIRAEPGAQFERITSKEYRLDPENLDEYGRLLRDAYPTGTRCRGVIHLLGLGRKPWEQRTTEAVEADVSRCTLSALFLVQSILDQPWRDLPKQWFVTRGVQTGGGTQTTSGHAALWGMAPTMHLEHPELLYSLVDLPAQPCANDVAALLEELAMSDGEERVALRDGNRYVARLVRKAPAISNTFVPRTEGTYLITGGLGGLGLKVAQWLAKGGAKSLVLVGRKPPSQAVQAAVAEIQEGGTEITIAQCDIGKRDEVVSLLKRIDHDGRPLLGVFHAAGVVADSTLPRMGREQFLKVFPAKVAGCWNLHVLTRDRPLEVFVLFSSIASLLGSPGQVNYAAANAVMDFLARARRAEGLPATSIHWGPFSDVGMAVAEKGRAERLAYRGLEALSVDDGLRALGLILGQSITEIAVAHLNVRRWFDVLPHTANSPVWSDLRHEVDTRQTRAIAESVTFRDKFEQSSITERALLVEELARKRLGQVLRMDPTRIDAQTPLRSLGIDSLMSLEVKNQLEQSLGLRLPATLLFTFSTLSLLTAHLLSELSAALQPQALIPASEQPSEAATDNVPSMNPDDDLLADFDATMQLVKSLTP